MLYFCKGVVRIFISDNLYEKSPENFGAFFWLVVILKEHFLSNYSAVS